MPITVEDINAMRARVKAQLEAHQKGVRNSEEALVALDIMERVVRAEEAAQPTSMTLPGIEADVPPQINPAPTFAQAVRDAAFATLGEFTVFDIEEALRKRGQPMPNNPLILASRWS